MKSGPILFVSAKAISGAGSKGSRRLARRIGGTRVILEFTMSRRTCSVTTDTAADAGADFSAADQGLVRLIGAQTCFVLA